VFPARYVLVFYFLEDGILHSHRCENFKSYIESKEFMEAGEY
jgi:hypothetical protein